ncbi:MAG TPA: hypothetical protein VER83_04165 [Candidatus Nanopelagicales bacterium]|nr:hypothetical protein [Candidatus Nanopelagicales bacterium]
MNALTAAGWTVRVTGLVMIVLGLLIWADVGSGLASIHSLIGIVLVVALATAAALALRAGARPILPAIAIAWGLLTIAFGMTQATILAGDQHFIVEVAHLLVGLVAIGLGEALMAAGRRGAGIPA